MTSSYSLFELSSAQNRQDVVLNLWKKCDGYLIIVEEGSRRGYQLINEARDFVLSLEDHSLIGHVFAPVSIVDYIRYSVCFIYYTEYVLFKSEKLTAI